MLAEAEAVKQVLLAILVWTQKQHKLKRKNEEESAFWSTQRIPKEFEAKRHKVLPIQVHG